MKKKFNIQNCLISVLTVIVLAFTSGVIAQPSIPSHSNIKISGGVGTSKKLLSVNTTGNLTDLYDKDDNSGRQRWIIQLSPDGQSYNILVEGGITNGYSYLSTTADGSKVDLYSRDDGSGRQRWIIEPIPQSKNFHIMIRGGVSNGRKYLSTTADGSKVDLYHIDDNSGRQLWQLIPLTGNQPDPSNSIPELNSVPSATKIFSDASFARKMGLPTSVIQQAGSELLFPVDFNFPDFYVIPANQRPKVMDQGDCPACVAYATSAALSTMIFKQPIISKAVLNVDSAADIAPDPMTLFTTGGKNCQSTGWNYGDALKQLQSTDIMMNMGIINSLRIPMPGITASVGKVGYINDKTKLPAGANKIDAMRQFIYNHGALLSRMNVFVTFNTYKSGIYNHQKFLTQLTETFKRLMPNAQPTTIDVLVNPFKTSIGGHAVTVIGYFKGGKLNASKFLTSLGVNNPQILDILKSTIIDLPAFWVVQNSWGKDWGINGLFLIEANDPDVKLEEQMIYLLDPIVKKNGVRVGTPALDLMPHDNNVVLFEQCVKEVQGKVAWNKAGNTSWEPTNVNDLCYRTTDPAGTIACFRSEIQKNDNWNQAIETCKKK